MTDRLADLQRGQRISNASATSDLEAGLDDESERLLQSFNREAEAIDKVLVWAADKINSVRNSGRDEFAAASHSSDLETVETKVHAVRRRLKTMADSNKKFAREHSNRPATVRTRIVRYTKLGNDFVAVTKNLSQARDQHRAQLTVGVKRAVMDANPRASEQEVERAIGSGAQHQLDSVLSDARSTAARHQLEDIRERNKDIQKLVRSVAELNQIFQDMSILVETQQDLVNEIEFTVQEVKGDVKQANEELVQARAHQKSRNKKKMWCIILAVVIVLIIVLTILFALLKTIGPLAAANQNRVRRMVSNEHGHGAPIAIEQIVNRLNDNARR